MPKVKSYSAAWLAKNAPGHRLFEPSADTLRSRALSPPYSSKKKPIAGPRRTIARRGTEVFVAVGKEIRWGDVAYLKEEWSSKHSKGRSGSAPGIKREDSTQSVLGDEDLDSSLGWRVRLVYSQHSQ
jgi:nucleoporin NUP82